MHELQNTKGKAQKFKFESEQAMKASDENTVILKQKIEYASQESNEQNKQITDLKI